jgi:uridine phosphorylase
MTKPIAESELLINSDGSIYHLGLKPGEVAEKIIAVGDPGRVEKVSSYFDRVVVKRSHRDYVTHTGLFKGKALSVMSTGMGTDNVEIFLTELDALFNVDFDTRLPKNNLHRLEIVRVGTSGSLQGDLPIDGVLASEYAIGLDTLMQYYDFRQGDEESAFLNKLKISTGLGFIPYMAKASPSLLEKFGKEFFTGITLTCPGFFAPQGRKVRLTPKLPKLLENLSEMSFKGKRLTNFEMETAGYYSLCQLLGHEVLSLNLLIADRKNGLFSKDPALAMDQMIRKVLEKF